MYGSSHEPGSGSASSTAVTAGCLAAYLVEQVRDLGCGDFADALDACLDGHIKTLSREEQRRIIKLSYDMMVKDHQAPPARLRLVHSRD